MTCVSSSGLGRAITNASKDVISCVVGDDRVKVLIPQHHVGQVPQRALVLALNHVIFVSSSKTGLLYVCVVNVTMKI